MSFIEIVVKIAGKIVGRVALLLYAKVSARVDPIAFSPDCFPERVRSEPISSGTIRFYIDAVPDITPICTIPFTVCINNKLTGSVTELSEISVGKVLPGVIFTYSASSV